MSILNEKEALLMIIDIQEKLINAVYNKPEILKNAEIIAKTAKILDIPYIVTEQYPKGLGSTSTIIKTQLDKDENYYEKITFNALENPEIYNFIKTSGKKQIILAGIETHICVRQTANALLNEGFDISVLSDCCGSRLENEHFAGIDIIKQEGCRIKTTETSIFELLKSAKHHKFKEIQALIK